MEIPIQPDDVFILASLHFVAAVFLFVIAWRLLRREMRLPLAIGLGFVWFWSLAAMLDFMWEQTGFNSWFLSPSAEKNLPTMLSSTLLLMISLTALTILWRSAAHQNHQKSWQRGYWLLLALLFAFLAADEYFSIHESITFWRQGYLGLGALVALLGLIMLVMNQSIRLPLLMFLVGLGTMGVFGVLLDAFSAGHVVSIGSFEPKFMACRDEFLGVMCNNYNNTEETAELFGTIIMLISLLSVVNLWSSEKQWKSGLTIIFELGGAWLIGIALWLWLIPAGETLFAQSANANLGDLSLVAYSVSDNTIEAGETLDVTIYMRVNHSITSDYSLSLHLYTQALPEIESIAQDDMELGEFKYPTRAWLPYLPVRNHFQLVIPDDLATSASYQLVAILWQDTPNNKIAVQETALNTLSDGTVLVLEGIAAPPQNIAAVPMSAAYDFAPNFSLEGYDLPSQATVGESLSVGFWWSTEEALDLELTHFLHWFHSETGEYVIFDQIPFAGAFPSQDWSMNLLAHDAWTVTLPNNMPTGTYRVQTGMFTENGERVSVTDAEGHPILDNSIVLGTVIVE